MSRNERTVPQQSRAGTEHPRLMGHHTEFVRSYYAVHRREIQEAVLLGKNPDKAKQLVHSINGLPPSLRRSLAGSFITGVASVTNEWPVDTRDTIHDIIPQIRLQALDSHSLHRLHTTYLTAVSGQRTREDNVDTLALLLAIGKVLVPHFAKATIDPTLISRTITDVLPTIPPATPRHTQQVLEQERDEIETAVGLITIEDAYSTRAKPRTHVAYETYLTNPHTTIAEITQTISSNHPYGPTSRLIHARQLVFLHRAGSIEAIMKKTGLSRGEVKNIVTWLQLYGFTLDPPEETKQQGRPRGEGVFDRNKRVFHYRDATIPEIMDKAQVTKSQAVRSLQYLRSIGIPIALKHGKRSPENTYSMREQSVLVCKDSSIKAIMAQTGLTRKQVYTTLASLRAKGVDILPKLRGRKRRSEKSSEPPKRIQRKIRFKERDLTVLRMSQADKSIEDIMAALTLNRTQVYNIRHRLREAGYTFTREKAPGNKKTPATIEREEKVNMLKTLSVPEIAQQTGYTRQQVSETLHALRRQGEEIPKKKKGDRNKERNDLVRPYVAAPMATIIRNTGLSQEEIQKAFRQLRHEGVFIDRTQFRGKGTKKS